MREIKFRGWIQEDEWDENDPPKMIMTYDLAFEEFEPINDLLAGVKHLMQYTGLKDKNGEEIYEGDIVRYDATFLGASAPIERISVVEYKAPEFSPHHLSNVSGYGLEVIGNIHENAELLKAKGV